MFVSINHIPVAEGRESDFEQLWRNRDRSVETQPGFRSLDILKPGMILSMSSDPPTKQDNTYHVLARWDSEQDFRNWVHSDAFKKAHAGGRDPSIFAGRPLVTTHQTIEGASA